MTDDLGINRHNVLSQRRDQRLRRHTEEIASVRPRFLIANNVAECSRPIHRTLVQQTERAIRLNSATPTSFDACVKNTNAA